MWNESVFMASELSVKYWRKSCYAISASLKDNCWQCGTRIHTVSPPACEHSGSFVSAIPSNTTGCLIQCEPGRTLSLCSTVTWCSKSTFACLRPVIHSLSCGLYMNALLSRFSRRSLMVYNWSGSSLVTWTANGGNGLDNENTRECARDLANCRTMFPCTGDHTDRQGGAFRR